MNFWISNRFSNGNTVEAPTAVAPAVEQPQVEQPVEQPKVEQPTDEAVISQAVETEAKPDFFYVALPNNADRSMTVTVDGPQPPAVEFAAAESEAVAEPEPQPEPEPEAPVKSEPDISWFTVFVSLAFGSAVFLLKHAFVTLVTLLTYVDTDVKAKYIPTK